jgi:hypothetical protein
MGNNRRPEEPADARYLFSYQNQQLQNEDNITGKYTDVTITLYYT